MAYGRHTNTLRMCTQMHYDISRRHTGQLDQKQIRPATCLDIHAFQILGMPLAFGSLLRHLSHDSDGSDNTAITHPHSIPTIKSPIVSTHPQSTLYTLNPY